MKNEIIDGVGYIWLGDRKTLPKGIKFNNHGSVNLEMLKKIPINTEFNNSTRVYLNKNVDISNLNYRETLKIYNKIFSDDNSFLSKKDLLPILREKKIKYNP